MIRDLADKKAIHYRLLASGKIEQRIVPGEHVLIEPDAQMRRFTHRNGSEVRAVQIPKPFIVGADLCTDGYLVLDDRGLKAISTQTFQKDYSPALTLDAA